MSDVGRSQQVPSPFRAPLPGRPGTATTTATVPEEAAPDAVAAFGAVTRFATAISVAVVATMIAITVVAPAVWDRAGATVLVLGLLVGVPHGAVDHLLPKYRRAVRAGPLAVLTLGYAAVAVLSWTVITVFRGAGLAAFLMLSAVHFGTGEATFARIRGRGRGRPRQSWGRGRGRGRVGLGAAIVLLPITAHPAQVAPYLEAFAPGLPWQLPPQVAAGTTVVILTGMAALVLTHLRAAACLQAAETTLLVAMMTLAPPAVALGVYFGGWHSVRHLAILLAENPRSRPDLGCRRFARPLRRFAVEAALPTGAALAVIGLTWFAGAHSNLHQFVAHDLAILAALTVPHTGAVWWLDHTRPPSSNHPGPP